MFHYSHIYILLLHLILWLAFFTILEILWTHITVYLKNGKIPFTVHTTTLFRPNMDLKILNKVLSICFLEHLSKLTALGQVGFLPTGKACNNVIQVLNPIHFFLVFTVHIASYSQHTLKGYMKAVLCNIYLGKNHEEGIWCLGPTYQFVKFNLQSLSLLV